MEDSKVSRYSEDDSLYIRTAWADGTPLDTICEKIGRTKDSIRAHANHHKVKRPAWYIEQLQREAQELCLDGRLNGTHRKQEALIEAAISHPPGFLLAESTIAKLYGSQRYEDAQVRPPVYRALRLPTPPAMISAASCLVQACG
jgi:hypothetical protein